MCTTSQYVYLCAHPASHRFRTSICRDPASTSCRIRDENAILPYTCSKCAAKTRTRNGKSTGERFRQTTDVNIMVAKKNWYVPSRCFIDVGFQNLNPFGTETQAERDDRGGPRSLLPPVSKVPLIVSGSSASSTIAEPARHPSPCCLRSRRIGAYQATRLEGLDDRLRGRIVDSFCGSCL
jgi:hypothetical protein